MANLTDALDYILKEELATGIRETRIKLDPIWEDIIVSSFGVQSGGLGRNWLYKRPYTRGLAGSYQFEASSVLEGPSLAYDDAGHAAILAAGNGFPTKFESTVPSFYDVEVKLKEARGNLHVPIKWMQLDRFDASVGSAVGQLFKMAAFKAALKHAMAMYTSNYSQFPVVTQLQVSTSGTVGTNGWDASNDTHAIITIDNSSASAPNGRIQMIHEGDTFDHYKSDNTKKNTTTHLIASRVDYLSNSFRLTPITTATGAVAATFEDATEANDFLSPRSNVAAGAIGNQTAGFNSWMVASGNIQPFTVNGSAMALADNPEWGSLVVSNVGGPLTERVLTRYIGRFLERVGTMCDLDTIITPAGVVHAYLENEDNLSSYERNGRRLEVKGGWSSVDYAYQGKGFRWAISTFIEPKAAYVIKLKNNIRELVPPSLPGTGSHPDFSNEFKFIAPLGGFKGAFMFENMAPQDLLQAPYYRICEVFPENQPQGIILRGLDETI